MDGRGWWTVVLTALASPLGSFGIGLALARGAESTTGGMAVLAWAVVGLLIGGPLASLTVFGVCLVTLMRGLPLRRSVAMLLMAVTVTVGFFATIIGLRLVVGMEQPQVGLVVTVLATALIVGVGAFVALMLSRRAPAPPDRAG